MNAVNPGRERPQRAVSRRQGGKLQNLLRKVWNRQFSEGDFHIWKEASARLKNGAGQEMGQPPVTTARY